VVLAAACAGDGSQDVALARDSAGIRIVENEGIGAPTERFAETPVLTLGNDETRPETVFYQVAGAVRLEDGRIVVADGSSGELRFFGPDGAHLTTVGGLGGGPTEFGDLASLMRSAGDTLLAHDRGRQRIAMFTDSGRFASGVSYQALAFGSGAFLAGRLDDGSFVLVDPGEMAKVSIPVGLAPGQVRDTALIVRLAPDGNRADTVARVPGALWSVERVEQLGSIPFPVPMHYSPAPLVFAHGSRIVVGDADTYEIRILDAGTGRVEQILRKRHEPGAVREVDIETVMQRYRGQVGDDPNPAAAITLGLLENAPVPEHAPAFGGFPAPTLVDAAGWLWVPAYMPRLTAFGDSPENARVSHWDVFDAMREWQGRVASPPDFRLTDFRVHGVGVRTVGDVEQVVVLASGMGSRGKR
jgi:hypothetical protein